MNNLGHTPRARGATTSGSQVAYELEPFRSIDDVDSAIMETSSNLLFAGEPAMTITIEAIYENGVLRPTRPLPLREQEMVRITIEPELSWAERTAGLLQWQ